MAIPGLVTFNWSVHESGYVWGAGTPGTDPEAESWYRLLLPANPVGPVRRYDPLRKHRALFRTFAAINLHFEEDGIVKFANEFGLLGRLPIGYRLVDVPWEEMEIPEGLDNWDIYILWRWAILSMRDLVQLWDLVHSEDHARLKQHIVWEGKDKVTYYNGSDPFDQVIAVITSDRVRSEWLDYFHPGDIVTPAKFYLMNQVNLWMTGLVDPRLEWDKKANRLVTRLVPGSLLGALWLQFHQAISGQTEFRECKICKTWFEVAPKASRKSRIYCDDACRAQALRDRQKRARELHEKGMAIEEIAQEVGSEVQTVNNWISTKKE
jgi:hypothetical protein